VLISAEVGLRAPDDGYVSITIPEVHCTVLSTPSFASPAAYNFSFNSGAWGNFYGSFNGFLKGTA
jgi:hypothetical protein